MLKSFAELEQEHGPPSIYTADNTPSQRPFLEGYGAPPESPSLGDTISAAYRGGNTIAAALTKRDTGMDNYNDGEFDPVAYVKDHNLQGYESTFAPILNTQYADRAREQIEMQKHDTQTVAASGWTGTLAGFAAGATDLPMLIPGTAAVKGVKGGWSIAKSMLAGGASAAAAAAASETGLQISQDNRPVSESLVNVGVGAVIGSMLGGGAAALLSRGERASVTKAVGEIADMNSGAKPNEPIPMHLLDEGTPASGGAAVNPAVLADREINAARSREDTAVSGRVTKAIAQATDFVNPTLGLADSPSATARQLGMTLYTNVIGRDMHLRGETTGQAAEALYRSSVEGDTYMVNKAMDDIYNKMQYSGAKMSQEDFYREVSWAGIHNDEHENQFVAQAAQANRKFYDKFAETAEKLGNELNDKGIEDHPFVGFADERARDLANADSYARTIPNRQVLKGSEATFLDEVGRHYTDQIQKSYAMEAPELKAFSDKIDAQISDLRLTGQERAQRIGDLNTQAAALDAKNGHLIGTVSDIAEARGRQRAGDEAAAEQIKALQEQGGQPLNDYLAQRGELRQRMKNLTEKNPDAQLAKGEALNQRINDIHELTARSLGSFAARARNVINELRSNPKSIGQAQLKSIEAEAHVVQAKVQREQDFLGTLKAEVEDGRGADPLSAQKQDEALAAHEATLAKHEKSLADLTEALRYHEDAGPAFAEARAAKADALLKGLTKAQAARDLKRGADLKAIQDRAAKLTPEAVAERAKATEDALNEQRHAAREKFDAKWGPKKALGVERNEPYEFAAAGREAAQEHYDTWAGRTADKGDAPSFLARITSGPLKKRGFTYPMEDAMRRGWVETDARALNTNYARNMAGVTELTRRYTYPDMREQLGAMGRDFSNMKTAVGSAKSVAEINSIIGSNKYRTSLDLEKVKTAAQVYLAGHEDGATKYVKGGRDLIMGAYNREANNSTYASIARSAGMFNIVRSMGGFFAKNLNSLYTPALVHGLGQYLHDLPGHLLRTVGAEMSVKEAQMAGVAISRFSHAMWVKAGSISDPYATKTLAVERFLKNLSSATGRWNLSNLSTDMSQSIGSTVSQHRILEAIMGNPDGTFVHGKGEALLRNLGISKSVQKDIAKLYEAHGEVVDDFKIANTEKWLAHANATGDPNEISRAEAAVRAYRTAINTDVHSMSSHQRGFGDAPLLNNTPTGRLLLQFSGYNLTAHTRIMMRAMQGDPARLISGVAGMTSVGALAATLLAYRSGATQWDKFKTDVTANPMILLAHALDNAGVAPLMFDGANRVEQISGAVGSGYRFNPIKTPLAALGGGAPTGGISTPFPSDSTGFFNAVGGPTVGMAEDAVSAARVVGDKAQGLTPPKRDANRSVALLPFNTYPFARELIQIVNGNSAYIHSMQGN